LKTQQALDLLEFFVLTRTVINHGQKKLLIFGQN